MRLRPSFQNGALFLDGALFSGEEHRQSRAKHALGPVLRGKQGETHRRMQHEQSTTAARAKHDRSVVSRENRRIVEGHRKRHFNCEEEDLTS